MTSLTTRGRVAVVAGLVVSAGLCAGAAVALVKTSDHSSTTGLLPQLHPTLGLPSGTPSTAPSATPSPSSAATPAPTATPRASASPTRAAATSSPRATRRPTHQPTLVPVAVAPAVDAELTPVAGQPGTLRLTVHATSADGPLTLTSVDWKDGTVAHDPSGTSCDAAPGGDCQDFVLSHTYTSTGTGKTYDITVVVSNGAGSTTVVLHTTVS